MKHTLTVLLLIGAFAFVQGQETLESLKRKLNEATTDSTKIVALTRLAREYQYTDLKKSFEHIQKAIDMAESKNLTWAKNLTYATIGNFHGISGDYYSALKFHDLALNMSIQIKDTLAMSKNYNNVGETSVILGKLDEAYYDFSQSYMLGSKMKDKLAMAIALHNLSTVFKEMGQYNRALDHLMMSQKLSDQVNDYEGEAYNLDEVGEIMRRMGNYDSAHRALSKALKVARSLRLNINDLVPDILIKIAKTYSTQNDHVRALAYYDSAYDLYIKTENEFGAASVELGRGIIFMNTRKFDQAKKFMEGSMKIANNTNAKKLEIECLQSLSKLYEDLGDYKKSLDYFKQYKGLEDSLYSQSMQAKLLQNQLLFETSAKEAQIKQLTRMEELSKAELKRENLIRNILVVVVALTAVLLFSVYRSGQRRIQINKLLLQHQEEIKKRSYELEQLNQVKDKFFSIISHDLRSPINALSAILDLLDKGNITPEEFSKLNKELRNQFNHTKGLINNLLDWALLQMDKLKIQPEKIDLHKLVTENFKLLSSLHLKDIKMINSIDTDTICWGDLNIVNLVLRNLILNSMKFTQNGGLIEAASQQQGDDIVVSIRDTGIGISPEIQNVIFEKTAGYTTRGTANEKGTGLGLILCKEFIEKNGGKIWLESEVGKGSTFYFTVKKAR
ncbi:MAG: tetratricopeptide repeat-containing sensor histidine kinase [Bacteroidetes bacterium]|nr:tetratricopeptide repeat-containing sensor histidine kinase [Bacteroidota bacterium]MBS1539395.1 tetratricopeptide repeat-containing sensor histidine kinase [Bacteroidota bacterium]